MRRPTPNFVSNQLSFFKFKTVQSVFYFSRTYVSIKQQLLENRRLKQVKPGKISPLNDVPSHIQVPPYIKHPLRDISVNPFGKIHIKTEEQIATMKRLGIIAKHVLDFAGTLVKVFGTVHLQM